MNKLNKKENFEIPIIGPLWRHITNCFSTENAVVSLIPLLALFFKDDKSTMNTIILIILFYILSVIGGVVLQLWGCNKQLDDDNFFGDLWDKTMTSAAGTWFIPLIFTILIVVNFIILNYPMFIKFKPLTIFIKKVMLLAIVMYIISWQNYCAFRAIAC
jgi:hypothetical protein